MSLDLIVDFGAIGDGIADDTAAFNAAIAYAKANGSCGRYGVKGITITIPDGIYRITESIDPVEVSFLRFKGESRDGAVILIDTTDPVFTYGKIGGLPGERVHGGGFDNVRIEYAITPTASSVVFYGDDATGLRFNDITVLKIGGLFRQGTSDTRRSGDIRVCNISGTVSNVGAPLIDLRFGSGFFMSDSYLLVEGVSVPSDGSPMATVPGTNVITTGNGLAWDTAQLTNCIFLYFDHGVLGYAKSGAIATTFCFSNVIFDYCKRQAVLLDSSGGGSVLDFRFDKDCWFVSWEEESIRLDCTAGVNDKHRFSGHSPISGKQGIRYSVPTAKECSFSDMNITGANRLGAVSESVCFVGGSTGFSVSNVKANRIAQPPYAGNQATYGLTIGANCDFYSVSDCTFGGAISGYNLAANTAGSANRRIHNNLNASYATKSVATVPASGATYTNKSAMVEEWNLFGGALTSGFNVNGFGYPGNFSGIIRLEPGGYFSIGYSVAPTAYKYIQV